MKTSFTVLLLLVCIVAHAQTPLEIKKIAPNVFVHISYNEYKGSTISSNGLLIETPSSVLLVDTAWGEEQTEQLIAWVKKEIKKPISQLIVTHSHADRTSGIPVLKKNYNTQVFANSLTTEKIKELKLPLPDVELPEDSLLQIKGKKIETYYPGGGHTTDNIVVYLPEEKILFGGCFIKSTEATDLGNIADADLKAWPVSAKKVKQKFPEVTTIIPGHQSWQQLNSIEHTLQLLQKHGANGN